jgi:hypothetical protein
MGREAAPSEVAMRAELILRLETALNSMDPLDRKAEGCQFIFLRHWGTTNELTPSNPVQSRSTRWQK